MANEGGTAQGANTAVQKDPLWKLYLGQFDYWTVRLIGCALVVAFLYGLFAGASPRTAPVSQKGAAPIGERSSTPTPKPTMTANAQPASATSPTALPTDGIGASAKTAVAPGTPQPSPSASAPSPKPPTDAIGQSAKTGEPVTSDTGLERTWSAIISGVLGGLLALSIAIAALAIGAFLGFLFGLPRTLTGDAPRRVTQTSTPSQAENGAHGDQPGTPARETTTQSVGSEVNTNLERISDWLTTIIVGVGLTKIEHATDGIERFGDIIDGYFGLGGKVFGISAGLFFLIAGFFLVYVSTRVKLSLVFESSKILNSTAPATIETATAVSLSASPTPEARPANQPASNEESALEAADTKILSRSLVDLKTDDEILAWANANARRGNPSAAVAAYQNVLKHKALTPELGAAYATVLASAGNAAKAEQVVAGLQATGVMNADAAVAARESVSKAPIDARRYRLQQGLYRFREKGYLDSIAAGEWLLTQPGQDDDSWVHLWLGCAYSQQLCALKQEHGDQPSPEQQAAQEALKAKAEAQVVRAIGLDQSLKGLVRDLYDVRYQKGDDTDLQSLAPSTDIEDLIADLPR